MRTWVAALRAEGAEETWRECRDAGLWGSGSSQAGKVQRGDEFFVWWSGRGWLARARFTSYPKVGSAYRWPWSPMLWVSEFEVLDELPSPKTSPGNPEPVSGLPTVRLGQFPEITDTDAIDRLRGLFG